MRVLIYIEWPVKAWCIPDAQVDALRRRFPEVDFVNVRDRAEVLSALREADAAFTPFLLAEWVAEAPCLRWVHSSAAAVEGLLPLPLLEQRGIAVSNSRGVQAVAMAENVLGGLLVLARRLNRTLEAQREHRWIQNDLIGDWPWLLHGKRMTIVGLGTIGAEVARRAHAFGMRITGIRRNVQLPRPQWVDRVLPPSQLDEALTDCEVLVLSAPGVEATRRIIGPEQIARLAPGAIIVNVARGQVVDEATLIDALRDGRLGGAVLDVFEREPLDAASPLWDMPNVVITPHSSGFRASHWDDV
ncbi:MAG TPA: D-2-hydroxyacid dehydrogenase, partial [Gemmatimonadaceae bacterium]|nr:D-2-hydroxyacid dehydrogenase [Gemmatimonadaceae bacterium]